ncbi:GNAT family N-acetyltransferase [Leucothrix arctica]|uniref:GNAT family N-acetyltransferase n=1 Tax=Leucothrix arctica TaxID=1481894 RepID=A0A317CGU7_9GAMM|nr:GNAT family N-acetyltransferase [Leucothrix arctica]PWQ97766.1 GNAT family N-acetyltransferase [Leucothrix arctica]
MKIKSFEIFDYESAVTFWKSIEGVTLNESDTKGSISSFLFRNPGLSFVAKDNNEIVGTILCGHNGRAAQIYHLAVSNSHRGQGLGKELVDLSLSKLVEANIPRCNIFVYSNNCVGNKFWLKNGWDDPTTWKVLQKQLDV